MNSKKESEQEGKKKKNEKLIDEYDFLGNAATAGDCTGLIPEGKVTEEDLETYREIYRFGAAIDGKKDTDS